MVRMGVLLWVMLAASLFGAPEARVDNSDSCVKCHAGIEHIRQPESDMMQQIAAMGQSMGDSKGCTVCHGGNPNDGSAEGAHKGAPKGHPGGLEAFVRDPGSIWISKQTCGICHPNHTPNLMKALMQTEAGKIQGNLYGWGTKPERKVTLGNYDVKDEDGKEPNWGTDVYKEYMVQMMNAHPDQFPTELKQLPAAPQGPEDFVGKSEEEIGVMGSLTYARTDCQRCHVGVRGRKGRGDFRGMGCSACHIPYGNEGYYEGKDENIDKNERGHVLVHSIQATRDAKVKVHDKEFSGIHPETCNSCHNRGKRIGPSYIGFMETDYNSPLREGGKAQDKTHGKKYMHIKDDLHFEAGMTCQDCHTSIDMHGDGTIFGTTLAQVEVECQDCHGTTEKYPWELPVGYSEEFGRELPNKGRGMTKELPFWMTEGKVYDVEGGYLLSARGNPLGNVVKNEGKNEAIAHLASGKDLKVPLLKEISKTNSWKSADAKVAMESVAKHNEEMECYACHADWAPQCYGCHIKVDYTKGGKSGTDWIASGSTHVNYNNGETIESVMEGGKSKHGDVKLYGHASETRSYLRWEDPILGVNGEGRITPLIPGCQTTFTVVGPDGKSLILNKQARVPDGPGYDVAGTDMAPVQPHTTGRKARTCESCHNNPKTLGYGISDGQFLRKMGQDFYMDIEDLATKKIVSDKATVQMKGIPGLDYDWSQIVTRDGKQLQTVGSHWEGSGPLLQKTRETMEKTGLCVGCHQNMVTPELWNKLNSDKKMTVQEHVKKMDELLKKAAGAQ